MDKNFEDLSEIPHIGKKRREALEENGIDTVEDFRKADFYDIIKLSPFGYTSAYKAKKSVKDSVINYRGMEKINEGKFNSTLTIGGEEIDPSVNIETIQPDKFEPEITTLWSFEERGDWATHEPSFRGNWSPKVARNLILQYSEEGDTVLDPMVGGGTTLIECALTGRNGIGMDVNRKAAILTKSRINFPKKYQEELLESNQEIYRGDCRNLNLVDDESIDLIATHPPYANIIDYGEDAVEGDLSAIPSYDIFAEEMKKAASEFYRVLKPGGYCAILIGDTRNRRHYVPISSKILKKFLDIGFLLKEDVIKAQWNCQSTPLWKSNGDKDFLLIMHEHLYIFRKPKEDEDTKKYKNSSESFLNG